MKIQEFRKIVRNIILEYIENSIEDQAKKDAEDVYKGITAGDKNVVQKVMTHAEPEKLIANIKILTNTVGHNAKLAVDGVKKIGDEKFTKLYDSGKLEKEEPTQADIKPNEPTKTPVAPAVQTTATTVKENFLNSFRRYTKNV